MGGVSQEHTLPLLTPGRAQQAGGSGERGWWCPWCVCGGLCLPWASVSAQNGPWSGGGMGGLGLLEDMRRVAQSLSPSRRRGSWGWEWSF